MQICSDPLRIVRSVRSDEQWCVTVPAGYPTIFSYKPNNVEYNGNEVLSIDPSNIDGTKFDCTRSKTPSMCANSQLIRRLQQGIDLHQTSPGNNPRQGYLLSSDAIKQHASNGNRSERINKNHIHQSMLSISRSMPIKSRNLSNGPIYSSGSSTYNNEQSTRSSQFTVTSSTNSSLTENTDHSDHTDNNSTHSSNFTDDNDESSVMSIPVPLTFSKTHSAKTQAVNDQLHRSEYNTVNSPSQYSDRQLNDDYLLSATNMTRSPSLTPSDDQQSIDSHSSSASSISTILSSDSNMSDSTQQESSTISSASSAKSKQTFNKKTTMNDDQRQSPLTTHHNKIKHKSKWLKRKNSKNYSPMHYTSHVQSNDQKQLKDHGGVDTNDPMIVLAHDLTDEARRALINQRKRSRQNRLMRLLTAPSRCCRTCRTQRRLASIAQRSINIVKNTRH